MILEELHRWWLEIGEVAEAAEEVSFVEVRTRVPKGPGVPQRWNQLPNEMRFQRAILVQQTILVKDAVLF
ncbi:hypothetical protein LIER_30752 [Lithospermum erythrorhizon]|uniref:Uncharacterized protein n=1 Tax=Lithospermum erythrorhizon TaxID=34254 RepID=A0AAV3RPB9_LITER